MTRQTRWILALVLLPLVCGCGARRARRADASRPGSFVIVNAKVADGSGTPLGDWNVRVEGDRIVEVGPKVRPSPSEPTVDAAGLVLAPGFIDTHNHSTEGLDSEPDAASQVSQGITTVLLGLDGGSPWPVGEYLAKRRRNPAALNVAVTVGHATVRRQVLGDDFRRAARPDEIARMEALVEQAMREGAVGLSSGLEYEVGSYATTEELVALTRVAAKHGGFYISHIRDEADHTLDAVRELVRIAEEARIPAQISHIKLGTLGVWGKTAEVAAIVQQARDRGLDISADCYPYTAWHSNLKVLVPSKRWKDPAAVQQALADVGGARNITVTRLPTHPDYEGRNLEEVAQAEDISPVELYMRIVDDEDATIIGHSMNEEDVRAFYQMPWVMVASDGGIGMPHPRATGTFPRVLGRFVRERGWLTLPEAIRKMTYLPAIRLRLKDRGRIRKGMKADLVLLNPDTVMDHSTFAEPGRLSHGIEKVFVNGVLVWNLGQSTGARPGRVLPE